MTIFICFVISGLFIIFYSEHESKKDFVEDKEGVKIVKVFVLGIPVLAGIFFMKPLLILASFTIFFTKCLITYYHRKSKNAFDDKASEALKNWQSR